MAAATFGDVLHYLRKTCDTSAARDLSDAVLLQRFLNIHDQAAFAILVQRHGPMVLAVCQRHLADPHAAEDAFQATFLVLVRRAGAIRKPGSLASWLHGVARHVAARARARFSAAQQRERRFEAMPQNQPLDELTWHELRGVLDEEIGRLPECCRAPVVLCYLEGKSYDEAARELGCPKSSLASRLGRARTLLRGQLGRRGIALSIPALAAAQYGRAAAGPITAAMTLSTVRAAAGAVAGRISSSLSVTAVALADETVTAMQVGRTSWAAVVLMLGLVLAGAGLAAYGAAENGGATSLPPTATQIEPQAGNKKDQPRADVFDDPLPDGAIERLGTVRFRHGMFVAKVAFALDSKVLISEGGGIGNFDVCIWDAATGRLRRRVPGTGSPAICSDGKALATVSGRLIDIETGKELLRLKGAEGGPAAISPDGLIVAGGEVTESAKVILWDAKTGRELRRLAGHAEHVTVLAFSADSKLVVSGSTDQTVRVWEVSSGKELHRFEGLKQPVRSVAFSPAGHIVAASIRGEQVIRLWDADAGKLLHQIQNDGDLAFAPPDGKLLAGGCGDGMVRLWDVATGQEVRKWAANHWGPAGLNTVAFSPDGKVLASGGIYDHAIRLWDPATGKELRPAAGHTGVVASLRFAPDGKTVYSSGDDNRVVEWDLAAGRERRLLFGEGMVQDGWSWTAHTLSSDGKTLAVIGSTTVKGDPRIRQIDPAIRLLDLATGKELLALKNAVWVRSIAFSADRKLVAADGKDGIYVWDVTAGKEVLRLPGQRLHRGTLVFSPDSKLLAWAGDGDRALHVCEVATGKEPQQWEAQREKTRLVAFAPDGKTVATATREQVHVWSVATGQRLMQFSTKTMVESLAFSHSGRVLAAGGDSFNEKTGKPEPASPVHLWELYSGQEIRVIGAPQGSVSALAFAPDDRSLASGGGDSTILLWDLTYRPDQAQAAPTEKRLDSLWSDLGGDAPRADKALWSLVRSGDAGMQFLRTRLQPAKPADAKQVAALIDELDSTSFTQRDKAARTLEELGESVEKSLRDALAAKPPLEVQQRIARILEKRDQAALRQLRAIEALEQIATAGARRVLEALSEDSPNPRVSEAARGAVSRLGHNSLK
jgi:RNA polymerase sigma factor (sigma-70 family)